MLIAHAGIGVFIVGVTLVKGYETEKDVRMSVGDTVALGGHTFRFLGATEVKGPNYVAARGRIEVSRNGRIVRTLEPEKRHYTVQNQVMTEAAIDTGLVRDLYVALGEQVDGGTAWTVRVHVKPFVDWIWGGCALMALGGFIAICDRRYRRFRRQSEALEGQPSAARAPVSMGDAAQGVEG